MNDYEPQVVWFRATPDALRRIGCAVVKAATGEDPDPAIMPITEDGLRIGTWRGFTISLVIWRPRAQPAWAPVDIWRDLYMVAHGHFAYHQYKTWLDEIPDALALVGRGGDGVEVMDVETPETRRLARERTIQALSGEHDWDRELEVARNRAGWRRGPAPA